MLATVIHGFPFLDLAFHYGCTIVVAVLLARFVAYRKRSVLAIWCILGVVIALALSYPMGYFNTGEYRTWWSIEEKFSIDYSLNDWRVVWIPDLSIFVIGPFYTSWLVCRWNRRCWISKPGSCESCGSLHHKDPKITKQGSKTS